MNKRSKQLFPLSTKASITTKPRRLQIVYFCVTSFQLLHQLVQAKLGEVIMDN